MQATSKSPNAFIQLKILSIRKRAALLTGLRKSLSLQGKPDLTPEQWEALEIQLAAVSSRILQKLRVYTDRYFSERYDPDHSRTLVNLLGDLELELTTAYNFYDTYMDILTQRLSSEIGPLMKGCDAIAFHALDRAGLGSISVQPLVFCDRGFGASTLREGVSVSADTPNPIPFIGIPYSRISEKYNLISIFHEVGHQALTRLNMVGLWQQVFREAMTRAGASPIIAGLYANWSKEIVPDFWAFCLSGMAQTCSVRDVLMLPQDMMFGFSPARPHPPSYLRFLVSVEWCSQLWGRGEWNDWKMDWENLYRPDRLDPTTRRIIEEAKRFIPVAGKALLQTRFKKLDNKPLTTLFDLDTLHPDSLRNLSTLEEIQKDTFREHPVGVQLAAFRLLREKHKTKQSRVDRVMDAWLKGLRNS